MSLSAAAGAASGGTAFDRRRVRGPEHSRPPVYSSRHFQQQHQNEDGQEAGTSHAAGAGGAAAAVKKQSSRGGAVDGTGRQDGRREDEPRPIFLRTGLISRAAGSAYLETTTTTSGGSKGVGGIKLACAVYGPKPKPPPFAARGGLTVEVKYAPFASDPRKAPLRDTEPPHLSSLLHAALLPAIRLETLPKSSIDVHVLVLESPALASGQGAVEATLAAALSCASAAVADAGIAMAGLAVGTVAAAFEEDAGEGARDGQGAKQKKLSSTIRLDPDEHEGAQASAIVSVGTLPALDLVTDAWMTGEAEVEEVVAMIDAAVKASAQAHGVVAQTLVQGVSERERLAQASA